MDASPAEAEPLLIAGLSLTECAVWVVRVVLPVILFFVWYQAQADKAPSGPSYQRDEIIRARQALEAEEPLEALRTLRLAPEAQVQRLLGHPPPRGDRAGGGAGVRREGGGRGKGKGEKGAGRGGRGAGRGGEALPLACPAPAADDSGALSEEDRLHFESLLNFVAFSYKDRPKRVFLPDDENPPPPPRRPALDRAGRAADGPGVDSAQEAKANLEAQLVLKGLLNPKLGIKSSEVAKTLSQHLADHQVRPVEVTYSLLVQSCVAAGDLRSASDLLMKMESAGHCADADLLDKVMDLYTDAREPRGSPAVGRAGSGPPGGGGGGAGSPLRQPAAAPRPPPVRLLGEDMDVAFRPSRSSGLGGPAAAAPRSRPGRPAGEVAARPGEGPRGALSEDEDFPWDDD